MSLAMQPSRSIAWLVVALLAPACAVSVTPPGAVPTFDAGRADASVEPPRDVATSVVCVLPDDSTCRPGHVCSAGPCMTCDCQPDGTCRWAGCFEDAASDAPVAARSCTTAADCGPAQACLFDAPGCDVAGRCGPVPECDHAVRFCGCDGATFEDCPMQPTRSWVSSGACGDDPPPPLVACDGSHIGCGGLDPPVCPAGEVPSVVGSCWGPCVPFARCAPIPCGDFADNCPPRTWCPVFDGGPPHCVLDTR